MEMFTRPGVAPVDLPPLLDVRAIDAAVLAKVLAAHPAYRIELPCRETVKGFRRVEAALKEHGTTLVIEKEAQNRLSKPRLKTNYAIFLEDLTGEEVARVLARVGSDDRKAAQAKPKPDGQFSKMVVNRLSDADRKELSDLLRADTRPPRPETARPPARGPERQGLAVTYNPVRPAAGSAEVKRFFDGRKPLRPGAVQVVLVLRETPG
jgi:hypothetical protein